MNDFPFILQLQRSLPAQALPWVTAAIRQDELVWLCLQEAGFGARALARAADQPEAWSPAALALLALDLPLTPQRLSADIHYPLESRLRRKIAAAAKQASAAQGTPALQGTPGAETAPPPARPLPGEADLGQAGLLALALRERRRMVGSWEGLPADLEKIGRPANEALPPAAPLPHTFWKTPLACLFGLVPDPLEMLASLSSAALPPGAETRPATPPPGSPAAGGWAPLAVHALLANPLPPEVAARYLQDLLQRLPQPERLHILRALALQRPGLAADLARLVIRRTPTAGRAEAAPPGSAGLSGPGLPGHLPLDPLDDLYHLDHLLHQAQVQQIADGLPRAIPLLRLARETATHLHAELTAQIALALQGEDLQSALAAWEGAVSLSPDNLHYRLGLVLALLEAGRSGEGRQWLPIEQPEFPNEVQALSGSPDDTTPIAQRDEALDHLQAYTAARLATASGDIDHARLLARHLLDLLEKEPGARGLTGFNAFLPATAVPKLTLDLGLAREAARAAQILLKERPTDLDLLVLEGEAWARVEAPAQAVQALRTAVSLAPGRPDLHRQLAGYLEMQGDWEAALEQRAAVCAQSGAEHAAPARQVLDLRALAGCAMHAGQPQRTIEACHQALLLEAEDGLSHLFLGQALASTGDLPAAQDHLLQATRLSPALEESWLSLANLQHQLGDPARALETLASAAQALPDSAEIHLALGEAYSAGWEGRGVPLPTQALASFQHAAALAPTHTRITLRLGQTLFELGHLLEARQTLERGYTAEPAFPGLAHAYAQALLSLGEQGEAIPVLAAVVADPSYAQDPAPHLAYARCLLTAGAAPQLAAASLRHVLSLDPAEAVNGPDAAGRVVWAEARALLAEAQAASGDMAAAMAAYQAAMETSLVDDPVWAARLSLGLGRAALALGQTEIAVAALQEASQADPRDPVIARSLAEACYAAGLLENALQAARTALRLAPDDLDLLVWFTEQANRWIHSETVSNARSGLAAQAHSHPEGGAGHGSRGFSLTPAAISQLRTETLNALTRALQFEPQRADLLVRLGRAQGEAGDPQAALSAYHQVITSASAAPGDLEEAARGLLDLGDPAGAVTCLEKALSPKAISEKAISEKALSKAGCSTPELARLQALLAAAYEKAGNLAAALATLESAMAGLPVSQADGDLGRRPPTASPLSACTLDLYRSRSRLLLALDRPAEALACLQSALSQAGEGAGTHDLCYQTARLLRALGNLPEALTQTERILSTTDPSAPSPFTLPAQVLAAELANSLLLPERARAFLGATPPTSPETAGQAAARPPAHALHDFAYYCLRAELALDWNDAILAAESFGKAGEAIAGAVRADGSPLEAGLSSEAGYQVLQSRLLAVQSRLEILHGDNAAALAMLQEAARSLPGSTPSHLGFTTQNLPLSTHLSMGEAALQLDQWDLAIGLFQKAVETASQEPLSHLSLARALVLRAEKERLFQALEVIYHAPGAAALSRQAAATFDQAIDAAHQGISKWLAPEGFPRGEAGRAGSSIYPLVDTGLYAPPVYQAPPVRQALPAAGGASAPGEPGRKPGAVRSAPYRRSDVIQAQTMVSRWRARGQAIFQPGPHSAQALSATLAILPPNPEDVAAQIAALRCSTSPGIEPDPGHARPGRSLAAPNSASIATQAARAFPQHPLVLAQLALILASSDEHLQEALIAAQDALKFLGSASAGPLNQLWPVCNALAARMACKAHELETAWPAIHEALSCWPNEPRWHSLAAEIETAQGNPASAVEHLVQATGLEKNHLSHFLALGRAYLLQTGPAVELDGTESGTNGRHKKDPKGLPSGAHPIHQAIEAFEEACRLAPDQPEAWLALAEAQRAGQLLDRAAESAERAIDLVPEETRPRLLRAEIALQAGQPQAAYEQVMASLRLDGPESQRPGQFAGQAALLLTRTLDQLDRPAEALAALEKALSKAPQSLPLLLERVKLLRKLHGPKAATEALQKLGANYPDQPQVLAPLAFDLAEAGQKDTAIRTAQLALQAASRTETSGASTLSAFDPAALHALLGRLLRDAGQLDSAIHHLNEAIRLAPRTVEPYLELGRALQERRQHSQALQIYGQAAQVAPRDPRPYYQAGLALKESRDYLGAENMLRRAAALAPDDLGIHRQLGAVVALNLVHNRAGSKRNAA